MKKLIYLLILISSTFSCMAPKHVPQDVSLYSSFREHGTLDSSAVIKGGFLHGKNTIVYTDSNTMVIWGKKCDFKPGDKVFSYGEYWNGPYGCYCKYFIINDAGTIKYSILD